MNKPQSRWLDVFVAGIVFMSFLALKSTYQYGDTSLIIPITMILMMPIGEWCDRRIRVYKKVTSFCTVAFTLYLPLMVGQVGVIETVVNLFIFVQLYSMMHTKTISSYYHILLMSFFLLIATLVMSPSAAMGMVLFGYAVTACGCLLLLDQKDRSSTSQRIFFRSLGYGNSGIEQEGRNSNTIPLVGFFFAVILALTSTIFVLIPRTEAGLLGTAVDTSVYTTGLSDEVGLDVTGTLKNDSTAIMRIQFLDIPDGKYSGEMYWRSTTMDKYDGSRWVRQGLSTKPGGSYFTWHAFQNSRSPFINFEWARSKKVGSKEIIRYEIFMDQYRDGGFPLLSPISYITPTDPADEKELYFYYDGGGDFTVHMNYRSEISPYFVGRSRLLEYDPAELRNSSSEYMDTMLPSDFRLLTEQNLEQRTLTVVQEITRGAETNYDRVALIERYLSGNLFQYTRDIPFLDPNQPIDDFVHNVRRGHCELYASAMALMVRSQDIPARVVSGYRGGTWDGGSKSYTIASNMAHLWVEVYFPDLGWVTFDPAPGTSELELTRWEMFQNAWAQYSLQARVFWLKNVVGYSPNESITFMRDEAFRIVGNLFSAGSGGDGQRRSVSIFERVQAAVIVLFAGSAVVLFCVFIYRVFLRQPVAVGVTLSREQAQAKRLYTQLLHRLKSMGLHDENLTAEEVLLKLESISENIHSELRSFVERYHDARFGSKQLTSDELLYYRRMIRDLKKSTSE